MGDVPAPSGEVIRTGYAEDRELKASVIPSGRTAQQGGGSYAFDANNPDIPQNIIVCEGGEMKKVAQVTRSQMTNSKTAPNLPPSEVGPPTPAEVEKGAANVEEFYKDLDASKTQGVMHQPREHTPEGAPRSPEFVKPIYVTIKGPFGKIRQPFSKVFRDDMCLVLKVDHRTLPASYELPDLEDDEVMQLELKIEEHVVQCIWAGIQFTEPDASATFTVLLIQEETDIEEGRLR